jgi:hypothetical protein
VIACFRIQSLCKVRSETDGSMKLACCAIRAIEGMVVVVDACNMVEVLWVRLWIVGRYCRLHSG